MATNISATSNATSLQATSTSIEAPNTSSTNAAPSTASSTASTIQSTQQSSAVESRFSFSKIKESCLNCLKSIRDMAVAFFERIAVRLGLRHDRQDIEFTRSWIELVQQPQNRPALIEQLRQNDGNGWNQFGRFVAFGIVKTAIQNASASDVQLAPFFNSLRTALQSPIDRLTQLRFPPQGSNTMATASTAAPRQNSEYLLIMQMHLRALFTQGRALPTERPNNISDAGFNAMHAIANDITAAGDNLARNTQFRALVNHVLQQIPQQTSSTTSTAETETPVSTQATAGTSASTTV